MTRRTRNVTITEDGRDKGKVFLLREMPADQGERWANRALLALANAGAKLPDGILDAGMSGLAAVRGPLMLVMGLRALAGLRYPDIEDLLQEMMAQIKFSPGKNFPEQDIFEGENSQIEEIATFWKLRLEYVELLLGFSLAGALSTSDQPAPAPPAS